MRTLNDFIQSVKNTGFSRQNNFEMVIGIPEKIQNANARNISLMCSVANTPGINFNAEEEHFEGGDRRKYIHDYIKSELTMTFYVDSDLNIVKFFDSWKKLITVNNKRTFGYYDDYVSKLSYLYILGGDGKRDESAGVYKIFDLMPTSIREMNLDWQANGLQTITVTFLYKAFEFKLKREITGADNQLPPSDLPTQTGQNQIIGASEAVAAIIQEQTATAAVIAFDEVTDGMNSVVALKQALAQGDITSVVASVENGATSVVNTAEASKDIYESIVKDPGLAGVLQSANLTVNGLLASYDNAVNNAKNAVQQGLGNFDLAGIGGALSNSATLFTEVTSRINALSAITGTLGNTALTNKLNNLSKTMTGITGVASGLGTASTQASTSDITGAVQTTRNQTQPNIKDAAAALKSLKGLLF